jgi:hypothetical protein
MTETTHTLLDDAANLMQAHGCKGHSRVRAAKGVIPNVPLSPRAQDDGVLTASPSPRIASAIATDLSCDPRDEPK